MKSINILYVNSNPYMGGAEKSLLELAKNIDPGRFKSQLLAMEKGQLSETFEAMGIQTHFASFPFFSKRRPWIYLNAISRIVQIIKTNQIDLIHVNCDRAVPHMVLAAKLTRRKIICHVRDMVRAWFLPKYVWYLNRSDRIIANSVATMKYCVRAGMDEDLLQVLYSYVDTEAFCNSDMRIREAQRKDWGLRPNQTAVGIIGSIYDRKGHLVLLKAAALLKRKISGARIVIVGEDYASCSSEYYQALTNYIKDNQLQNDVLFTGYHDDIPKVMSGLDILVVPSQDEAFGRVVVEGMASGLPVVGSNSGGIPEIISDGEDGLLFPSQDACTLAEAILRLCQEPELRRRLGEKGKASAMRFDLKLHVKLYEQTYQSIIDNRAESLPKIPVRDYLL